MTEDRSQLSVFGLFLCGLCVLCGETLADTPPAEEDVNKFAQQAKQTYDDFLNHTFEIRMRYEYFGGFRDPCEKEQLRKISLESVNDLDGIVNNQLNLKQSIEAYPKDDWEMRFGQTGLWRRSAAQLLKTTLSRLEVQYYLALAFDQRGQTDILHQILTQLDTLGNLSNSPDWHLLKAKTLALLSKPEPTYTPLAKKELDFILAQKDIPCQVQFRAELEMIKLSGQFTALADKIAQTECKYDNEIYLASACLGHRFEPASIEKTVSLFSHIQNQFGKIVLDDLQQRYKKDGLADVNELPVTAYEAELAAGAAPGEGLRTYGPIFEQLITAPKFRTPALLFTVGQAVIETSPAKTTRLSIEASRLMKEKPDRMLSLSAAAMAKYAIAASGGRYKINSDDCPLKIEAYENYFSIADPNSDESFNHIEYDYSSVLDSCGRENQSKQLLEKIAAAPGGYQNNAKFELITRQLQQAQTKAEKSPLIAQLADLISNIPSAASENHTILAEATILYCQTLIEDANAQSAQKVLDILVGNDSDPKFNLFKAQAFQQLGRLEESVRLMSQAIDTNDNSIAPQVVSLASEILDKIELLQQDAKDFNQMLKNCVALAEFADKSAKSNQAAVVLAEISILNGKKISFADENDISWLRPKARLLMAQRDFNQATLLWSKMAEIRRNDPVAPGQKSYNWWQAKFYELDCLAKSKADNQNIAHTIDVLFNTFPEIPSPWAKKLNLLKQQCVTGPPAN
jgi:uncharacterized protein Veg